MVITRFAPSPTGPPHLGNIRTAIYAWLFARSLGGQFLLRIEDTDKSREKEGSVKAILDSLFWLGLDYDNAKIGDTVLIFQSKRLKIYQRFAHKLIAEGHAYICTCSAARLRNLRERQIKAKQPPRYDGHCRNRREEISKKSNYVIRLKVPKEDKIEFEDLIHGQVSFANKLIDDQVLLKSDGFPTYHLANVVDDHLMGVTHVIRAEEWLSSTPKHLLLYKFLAWQPPLFAHLPMILGKDKSKLSKRHGAVSVLEYKRLGYLPEALFNYLALLGWHAPGDQEIFTRQDLIRGFSLDRVQKSPAIFDQDKLDWLDGYYIRQLADKELAERIVNYYRSVAQKEIPFLFRAYPSDFFIKSVKLIKDRLKKLSDFIELAKFIIQLPSYDSSLLIFKNSSQDEIKNSLKLSFILIEQQSEQNFSQLDRLFKEKIAQENFPVGLVLHPLRVALTGLKDSPGPLETAGVLGREECLRRLKLALQKLS